ncbi:MAG: undecaprenyl/decaprenyl-phosphate alpha-N-acetylglucosaminyl 1-phosphate transferase [Acidaminococcaceae bacterium]|nr:undecaprenyl/decaprenyl-phosphate alpha-N-acetylglucosaminyl 1-phosphate transferase [Acidaminococcaceae bacterium]MBR1590968.1 undecaprenyl/decaprenyl-phosphate alpha-N-acetylglucosaminyl 1-phosphate transferase [Acidaminococcaceae bacterium]
MDKPNERKVHKQVMPRLGGLAIFLSFLLAVFCSLPITRDLLGILLGGCWIVIVGILDDKYSLPAKVKLLGQILAAVILVVFDIKIEWLNNPFGGYFYLEYLSIPFTIFWVISFINVINLIDGLDGLAAGVSGIASITIILVAVHQGYYPLATLTAALAGGIFGFIHYNFNPATIFMGDTGSMFIGYMLAAISIFGAVKSAATIALIVPAVALGLPIMDTAFAILRRYSNGRPIFQPDKGHLHHRLLALGLTTKQAVLLMYAISIVLSLGAFVLALANVYIACAVIAVIVVAVAIGAKKIGILNDKM